MKRKSEAHYLGLGVGTAQRERSLAALKSFATLTGVDKTRRRIKSPRGVKLVLGAEGEAKRFLAKAASDGKKWDMINAEFFYG